MKRKIFIFLFLFFSFFSNTFSQIYQDKFEHISTKEGLSYSVVTCIYQDSRGFMWFGTHKGLNKFDGYNFTVYRHNDSLRHSISSDYIQNIHEDKSGNLWLATRNGLNRYDRNFDQFDVFTPETKNERSIPDNAILSIFQDKSGQTWVGTNDAIYRFNKNNSFSYVSVVEKNAEIEVRNIKSICEDKNENLYFASENGLIQLDKKRKFFKIFRTNEKDTTSLSNNTIHCLFVSQNGEILVGTNNGADEFLPQKNSFRHIKFVHNDFNLSKSEIYDIEQDKRGNFWFASFDNGLVSWNKKANSFNWYFNIPERSTSLTSNNILSLFVDKSGLLWIGFYGDESKGGLNTFDLVKISFNRLRKDNTKNSLLSNEINAIYQTQDKNLWIGTESGVSIYNFSTSEYKNLDKDNSLAGNSVFAFLEDKEGNIWVGTSENGLNKISKQNLSDGKFIFENFSKTKNNLISDDVLCLFSDSEGNIWVGTSRGISILKPNGSLIKEIEKKSLSNGIIQNFYEEVTKEKKIIWIATDNGLNQYEYSTNIAEGNIILDVPLPDTRIKHHSIYSILKTSENFLCFGTDTGLYMLSPNKQTLKLYTTRDGLPDNVIYGIIEDDEKQIWVSTNKGLSRMRKGENTDFIFTNYNTGNWLLCNSFNIGAFHRNDDGILFFGCNEGLIYFHPQNIKGNLYIPPVVMTNFELGFNPVKMSVDGSTPLKCHINETKTIELSYKQNTLYFEWAALSYIQSEKNEFAYIMEGFDENWRFVKNKRTATYTNLDPGRYIFRVKACNNDGVWNETGKAIEIIITPPVYKEPWFIVMSILIFIISIAVSIFIWDKRRAERYKQHQLELQQRQIDLQHQIALATEELNEQKDELNSQKEELEVTIENLKTAQGQLVQSEKMASLGQLTAGVAHEINNPINFISGNIPPIKRDIQDILSVIDEYDSIIRREKLDKTFASVSALKMTIDYEGLVDEINDLIRGMEEGVKRTSDIVKSLRNFSRLDENDMKSVNINGGIESTLQILKNKLKNKVEVILELGELPLITCYPGKINQVFMNIISNAIDAIESTGRITIKTFQTGKEKITVSIRDTGSGMPEEVRNRIFEPFYTTKEIGRGTGLGLFITYDIVEKHSGTIDVISELGKGTEFVIVLPINPTVSA